MPEELSKKEIALHRGAYIAAGLSLATPAQVESWLVAQMVQDGLPDCYNSRLEIIEWASDIGAIGDPDLGEGIVYYLAPAQLAGLPLVR